MQTISMGLMDIYFGYNGRVGDVQGTKRSIQEFQQLAKTSDTPEQRARYAQAASQLKNDILPKMQKEMEQLGKQLGLKPGQMGSTINKEDLIKENLAFKKDDKDIISFITDYQPGSYYSQKT
ncbi:hypothetical protein L1077_05645 [Pseudoalteromonas luteoviolacea]|uniref:Uncharacterized protein n=1 Tax=Pseudoalteromonas luteoviolacea H33 TaxID=1365251 RepID=A0A162ADW4_9GAMM|nr:hypothetical protein [Pseudoalteromonas luteoviolacea]KZN48183.1 hypothetical protein N476_22275 [Pseudoalteromonas luteoviolacea H33]KZN78197.1 hypothetical protein N477_10050 [Pseudoalteromonas luteoviolacea H33-S]MBQ4876652.1 hypothetical protein [Pseudoalteromonas luteoviolacea]MBQ4905559.1 hypothetical protein [Pseudoalteromonas luteoviolacea]MCF6438904.1 hypothetical protein [Pseudoalteromonas luteoviolacea]